MFLDIIGYAYNNVTLIQKEARNRVNPREQLRAVLFETLAIDNIFFHRSFSPPTLNFISDNIYVVVWLHWPLFTMLYCEAVHFS